MIKVSCLAWRLFHITKDNLHRRGVIGHESLWCVGDCGNEESLSHLLFLSVWFLLQVVRNQFGLPNGASRTILMSAGQR
jgi:hypothetical protein